MSARSQLAAVCCGIALATQACAQILGYDEDRPLVLGTGAVGGTGGGAGGMAGIGGIGGAGGTGGSGGMTTSSSSSNGGNECMVMSDCISTECKTATGCEMGFCQWDFAENGTKSVSQLYGDCLDRVCDGAGDFTDVNGEEVKDKYVWANPCYTSACGKDYDKAMPNDGVTCETPWGNPAGTCNNFKCVECMQESDCGMTETCTNGRCVPVSCNDGLLNGMGGMGGGGMGGMGGMAGVGGVGGLGGMGGLPGPETGIDCGGPECQPCGEGEGCNTSDDCKGVCDTSVSKCLAPSCSDGKLNNDESDRDCGGSCALENPPKKCVAFFKCLFPTDCESGVCFKGTCQEPTCSDLTQNGSETNVDCGGSCLPCP